MTNLNR